MSDAFSALVWAVLPPSASWRGEGIAQTIENILLHSPPDINYILVLSVEHIDSVRDVLGHKPNVKLVSFGYSFASNKKFRTLEDFLKALEGENVLQRALNKLERLATRLVRKATLYFAARHILKEHLDAVNIVFFPSPSNYQGNLTNKPKVIGFWDPFVFEYPAFADVRRFLLRRFIPLYSKYATAITTQSEANKAYLTHVLNIDSAKINVIQNGSPSYAEIFSAFERKLPVDVTVNKKNLFTYWPTIELSSPKSKGDLDGFISQKLNHSILFRLCETITDRSKIILVSTQYRPYKGFEALFSLLDRLVTIAPQYDFAFVFTAEFPAVVRGQLNGRYPWAVKSVYEMTRLTNIQHACLYKISDLVLHPSFAEGGPTPYPASEAASLGVASLTNIGRHTREMIQRDGVCISPVVTDFLDKDLAAGEILTLLTDSNKATQNVELINAKRIDWANASRCYAQVLTDIAKANHDR